MFDSQKIFDERVKTLLQNVPPQVFEQFQESVNNLTKVGVNSYNDLIAIVLNSTRFKNSVWMRFGYWDK